MSSGNSLHSFPGNKGSDINMNVDNLSVNMKNVGFEFSRFMVSDDFRGWLAIPIKGINNIGATLPENTHAIVAPLCPDYENPSNYFNEFKRQLFVDRNVPSTRSNIKITRPAGKKAYFAGLSYSAFDFDMPLPEIDVTGLKTRLGINDLTVANAFGEGFDGTIIGLTTLESDYSIYDYKRFHCCSTVHYPDVASSKAEHLLNMEMIQTNWQTGPRSNVIRGAIPTDWMPNNFSLAIGVTGAKIGGPSAYLWDSKGRRFPGGQGNSALSFGDGMTDSMLPVTTTDLNILIPDESEYLTVEVVGPGWFHYLRITGSAESEKGRGTDAVRTIVIMPVKVLIDIRYE